MKTFAIFTILTALSPLAIANDTSGGVNTNNWVHCDSCHAMINTVTGEKIPDSDNNNAPTQSTTEGKKAE